MPADGSNNQAARETIVAIGTPPGRGGIGIVRLSGREARAIAAPILRLRSELLPWRAQFCEIVDPETGVGADRVEPPARLDEAVVTYYQSPRSYTGEDVLEIAAHGSPVLLEWLLRALVARGARLARPGEFTERAFLAGRLDLTQAEAVRDLIEAQTMYQARVAASQLGGALSRRVQPVKAELLALIAQLEAGIDFAEDDTPVLSREAMAAAGERVAQQLAELAGTFAHGRLVHGGLTLCIVGEPNVGKSSLFNLLVERERAIVTSAPGTTRDLVTERISLGGIPVEVVDTAGLRAGPVDEAERLGIGRSREALAEADLVLVVLDGSEAVHGEPALPDGFGEIAAQRATLVLNKSDLLPEGAERAPQLPRQLASLPRVWTSAATGDGLPELRAVLAARLHLPAAGEQTGMVTNLRQQGAIEEAATAVRQAIEAAGAGVPEEMVLLDLYAALRALDALTGETTAEDVLGVIFSTFCIGK